MRSPDPAGHRLPHLLIAMGAVLALQVIPGTGVCQTRASADTARVRLAAIDEEMRSIDSEWASVEAQAEAVKDEIARLDRQRNLGRGERRHYDSLKQESEGLLERLDFLQARRTLLREDYTFYAVKLLRYLSNEIPRRRAAYEREPVESEARVRRFMEFETLVSERQAISSRLTRRSQLLYLNVSLEPDDTPESLREKADLLADNRDLLAKLLESLLSWKRELGEDQEILEEVRRLEEENDFFRTPDPMGGQSEIGRFEGLGEPIVLPPGLADLGPRLGFTDDVEMGWVEFENLMTRIDRVEHELGDDIRAMEGKRRIMLDEAGRREGAG